MPGIVGNVDLNIAYKDYPSIINNKKPDASSSDRKKESNSVINYVVKKGDTLVQGAIPILSEEDFLKLAER